MMIYFYAFHHDELILKINSSWWNIFKIIHHDEFFFSFVSSWWFLENLFHHWPSYVIIFYSSWWKTRLSSWCHHGASWGVMMVKIFIMVEYDGIWWKMMILKSSWGVMMDNDDVWWLTDSHDDSWSSWIVVEKRLPLT